MAKPFNPKPLRLIQTQWTRNTCTLLLPNIARRWSASDAAVLLIHTYAVYGMLTVDIDRTGSEVAGWGSTTLDTDRQGHFFIDRTQIYNRMLSAYDSEELETTSDRHTALHDCTLYMAHVQCDLLEIENCSPKIDVVSAVRAHVAGTWRARRK